MPNVEKWIVGENTLVFDEDTHTYWCNGIKCISVTQLLKYKFPKKYEGIDESILKRAAEKGSYIHETIEMFEKYGIESNEIQEFRDYLFLKNKFNFIAIENEKPIIIKYKDLVICGRLDLVLEENKKIGLGDIKCTSTFDKEYLAYQLNLYRIGFMQCYEKEIEFLRGIHLKNGVRKYAAIPINEGAAIELLEDYRRSLENGN